MGQNNKCPKHLPSDTMMDFERKINTLMWRILPLFTDGIYHKKNTNTLPSKLLNPKKFPRSNHKWHTKKNDENMSDLNAYNKASPHVWNPLPWYIHHLTANWCFLVYRSGAPSYVSESFKTRIDLSSENRKWSEKNPNWNLWERAAEGLTMICLSYILTIILKISCFTFAVHRSMCDDQLCASAADKIMPLLHPVECWRRHCIDAGRWPKKGGKLRTQ